MEGFTLIWYPGLVSYRYCHSILSRVMVYNKHWLSLSEGLGGRKKTDAFAPQTFGRQAVENYIKKNCQWPKFFWLFLNMYILWL